MRAVLRHVSFLRLVVMIAVRVLLTASNRAAIALLLVQRFGSFDMKRLQLQMLMPSLAAQSSRQYLAFERARN